MLEKFKVPPAAAKALLQSVGSGTFRITGAQVNSQTEPEGSGSYSSVTGRTALMGLTGLPVEMKIFPNGTTTMATDMPQDWEPTQLAAFAAGPALATSSNTLVFASAGLVTGVHNTYANEVKVPQGTALEPGLNVVTVMPISAAMATQPNQAIRNLAGIIFPSMAEAPQRRLLTQYPQCGDFSSEDLSVTFTGPANGTHMRLWARIPCTFRPGGESVELAFADTELSLQNEEPFFELSGKVNTSVRAQGFEFGYDAKLYSQYFSFNGSLQQQRSWQLGLAGRTLQLENITMDAAWCVCVYMGMCRRVVAMDRGACM